MRFADRSRMPPISKKPRQWLLTVAAAGALLPTSCAQEPDLDGDDAVDEDERTIDAGVVAAPDGGTPVPDAGRVLGVVVNPEPLDAGLVARPDSAILPGVVVGPPVGRPVLPDAGGHDAGPKDAGASAGGAKDAGKDAACPVLINGIILAPPDSGCSPLYPGIMPRNVDGD